MNSKNLHSKIEILHNWLRNQGLVSNVQLVESVSWLDLEKATETRLPQTPGIYILRLKKPRKSGSDIVYIGQTDNLNRRIGFLRGAIRSGTAPHSVGKR